MSKGTIIGIDLGTATTEAAVYRNGKVEMIPDLEGTIVTPSAVGLDESGNIIIGEKARAQFLMAPERTAIEIKRKIGTGERIRLGRQSYSAVDLSAMLLEHVKRYASQYLDEEIKRAVISVPAYFDDIQRQEVVEAGQKAGLIVERIINEPTAAALSYGMEHLEEESYILIYDLGGGTFDVTILELFEGVLEVKASSGDNRLGGKDFDEALIRYLQSRFEEKHQVSLENNTYAMARLKDQAEQCKIALSTQTEEDVRIPLLAEKNGIPLALEETVTRTQFEALIQELLERTHRPIRTAMGDSGLEKDDIQMVLLVGGSTRIPLVSRDIEAFLGMQPKSEIDPDYSVAEGAAIQAAIISGEISGADRMVMTDVNPYTLGVRVMTDFTDDYMSVVIPRNVTIPVTRHQIYYTSWDNQSVAEVEVYQGELKTASRNHFLGKFMIEDIPERAAGKESIDVTFSYNLNGMLEVGATIVSTGKSASITINMMDNGSEDRIDVSGWKDSPFAGDYRSTIRRAERALKNMQKMDDDSESYADELEEMIYQIKKAILEDNTDIADELEEDIRELMQEF